MHIERARQLEAMNQHLGLSGNARGSVRGVDKHKPDMLIEFVAMMHETLAEADMGDAWSRRNCHTVHDKANVLLKHAALEVFNVGQLERVYTLVQNPLALDQCLSSKALFDGEVSDEAVMLALEALRLGGVTRSFIRPDKIREPLASALCHSILTNLCKPEAALDDLSLYRSVVATACEHLIRKGDQQALVELVMANTGVFNKVYDFYKSDHVKHEWTAIVAIANTNMDALFLNAINAHCPDIFDHILSHKDMRDRVIKGFFSEDGVFDNAVFDISKLNPHPLINAQLIQDLAENLLFEDRYKNKSLLPILIDSWTKLEMDSSLGDTMLKSDSSTRRTVMDYQKYVRQLDEMEADQATFCKCPPDANIPVLEDLYVKPEDRMLATPKRRISHISLLLKTAMRASSIKVSENDVKLLVFCDHTWRLFRDLPMCRDAFADKSVADKLFHLVFNMDVADSTHKCAFMDQIRHMATQPAMRKFLVNITPDQYMILFSDPSDEVRKGLEKIHFKDPRNMRATLESSLGM